MAGIDWNEIRRIYFRGNRLLNWNYEYVAWRVKQGDTWHSHPLPPQGPLEIIRLQDPPHGEHIMLDITSHELRVWGLLLSRWVMLPDGRCRGDRSAEGSCAVFCAYEPQVLLQQGDVITNTKCRCGFLMVEGTRGALRCRNCNHFIPGL